MRRQILVCFFALLFADNLYAQVPPTLQPPPAVTNSAPPPLNLTITPDQQQQASPPSSLQQVTTKIGPVKPGDQVRLLRGTHIRSGPGDQAYICNVLEAGAVVTILDLPAPGSEYTPIAAPDNCYSLIPESALFYALFRPANLFLVPQKTKANTETLMDGSPANGEYLSSKSTLPKGSLVSVVSEKKIKIQGKEKIYCVIRVNGKERRFVRTADLEGVAEAAREAQSPLHLGASSSNPPNNFNYRTSNEPLYGSGQAQQASYEQEHLPPQVLNQVQAAELAYQNGMRYGGWEDARTRYQHLMEVDVLSVRILAKNRLEFISELQKNPPVVTTAMSPQQGGNNYQPMNREPWVPGSIAPARTNTPASTTSAPLPPKDVVIRSTPPAASQPTLASTNPSVNIPLYTGTAPVASSPPAQGTTTGTQLRQNPPSNVPTAKREKTTGRLHLAVQHDGFSQLYYLTNSQATATYFVRAVANSNIKLADYVGKYIEVEGVSFQAMIDGQQKPQINVDRVRLLQ